MIKHLSSNFSNIKVLRECEMSRKLGGESNLEILRKKFT